MALRFMNRFRTTGKFNIIMENLPLVIPTTWDPIAKGTGVILSNGNLTATNTADDSGRSTDGVSSGKYYYEMTIDVADDGAHGLASGNLVTTIHLASPTNAAHTIGGYFPDGTIRYNNMALGFGSNSWTSSDIISVAVDMATGKVWFAINGVWQGSGAPDPATGTDSIQDNNASIPLANTLSTSTVYAAYSDGSSAGDSVITANFGATPFTHSVPNGFFAGFGVLA